MVLLASTLAGAPAGPVSKCLSPGLPPEARWPPAVVFPLFSACPPALASRLSRRIDGPTYRRANLATPHKLEGFCEVCSLLGLPIDEVPQPELQVPGPGFCAGLGSVLARDREPKLPVGRLQS